MMCFEIKDEKVWEVTILHCLLKCLDVQVF